MKRLIVVAIVLAVVSILFIGFGFGSSAPGLLILPLCLTGPGFFMVLGALFSRLSLDYQLVPKMQAGQRQAGRAARQIRGDDYVQP